MAASKSLGPVARANRLAKIAVPLKGPVLRAHRAWERRAVKVDFPRRELLRYAPWYPQVKADWSAAASATNLWVPDEEDTTVRESSCKAPDPAAVLSHVRDGSGLVLHLNVEPEGKGVVMRARYCSHDRLSLSVKSIWTEDQRLSFEEYIAGEPCSVCQRPLLAEDLERSSMPLDAADAERNFETEHENCKGMRWGVADSGILHCGRCCPLPPLSPDQKEEIAGILAALAPQVIAHQRALQQQWEGSR